MPELKKFIESYRRFTKTAGIVSLNFADIFWSGGALFLMFGGPASQTWFDTFTIFIAALSTGVALSAIQQGISEYIMKRIEDNGTSEWTIFEMIMAFISFVFGVIDAVIDASALVYLVYGENPLLFYYYITTPQDERYPMFLLLAGVIFGLSLLVDYLNRFFLDEADQARKSSFVTTEYGQYDSFYQPQTGRRSDAPSRGISLTKSKSSRKNTSKRNSNY